jgi:hypothetical protein
MKQVFIRNIFAGDYLEVFLISAIASVIGIRFFLFITDYPAISGAGFHIAHMLWGGFFMMVALVLLLTYLNASIMWMSAILGGIGFGTFIDELGKFITHDNNYFYQPSIAIIYIIFIVLFLYLRSIEKRTRFSKKEYLINTLELMEQVALQDLDLQERKTLEKFLRRSDQTNPLVQGLKQVLVDIEHAESPRLSSIQRLLNSLKSFYRELIRNPLFPKLVVGLFVVNFFITIFVYGKAVYFLYDQWHTPVTLFYSKLTFAQIAETIASAVSGFCIIIGVLIMYRSRLQSYQWFKRSLMISIFFTQLFLFYREQLSAITVLTVNIILLAGLQYMIHEEELLEREEV